MRYYVKWLFLLFAGAVAAMAAELDFVPVPELLAEWQGIEYCVQKGIQPVVVCDSPHDGVYMQAAGSSAPEEKIANLPDVHAVPAAVAIQGNNLTQGLYLLFGAENAGEAGALWRLDLLRKEWKICSPCPDVPEGVDMLSYGVNHLAVGGKAETGWFYHSVTDIWQPIEELAGQPLRTQGDFIVFRDTSTGEEKVWNPRKKPAFGMMNYLVLFGYLILILGLGGGLSRKGKDSSGYFKAGGHVPWVISALSIFGAQVSAITYMAIPSKTFSSDWGYMAIYIAIILAVTIVVFLFAPFFRRLKISTAYEYLELRFNRTVRWFGSMMFVVLQISRIAVVLFLPAIALNVVTGVSVYACILIMGVICLAYTVAGGMRSIVWVEALQVLILLGGAILCLGILIDRQGGIVSFYSAAVAVGKLKTFDLHLDFVGPSFWAVLFGSGASTLIQYSCDQGVIQRYLATKDEKSAAKSLWMNAFMAIPSAILFFSIGTGLYLFFKANPTQLDPGLVQADAIFPWYMMTQLPVGVAGLLIAGIFAASQSTLSTSANAAATALTMDFYCLFGSKKSDHHQVRFARWMTLLIGVLAIGVAMMMAGWNIKSLWDQLGIYIGLFSSGLAGLFLLGMLTRRANGIGALTGLLVSAAVVWWVKDHTPIFFMLYAFIGIVVSFAVGYVISLLTGGNRKDITGLSVQFQSGEIPED